MTTISIQKESDHLHMFALVSVVLNSTIWVYFRINLIALHCYTWPTECLSTVINNMFAYVNQFHKHSIQAKAQHY